MSAEQIRRVFLEVRLLSRMEAPGLTGAHDVEVQGRRLVFAVDAPRSTHTLAELLEDGHARPVGRVRSIARDLGRALNRLHDRRMAHGDLHASRVLVHDDGTVSLLDLGLGRAGTPADERTDVHDLATLICACTRGDGVGAIPEQWAPHLLAAMSDDPKNRPETIDRLLIGLVRTRPTLRVVAAVA